ncbi:AmmeMemoRadiSam system protein B [Desulfococcaceae bacterium HSG8]|nr:AmmeMemoRadiSam system protein B [Desulfococcaceae bacterium HSG8]
MKKNALYIILTILIISSFSHAEMNQNFNDREPVRAGQFYPGTSSELSKTVKGYLEDAVKPSGERPVAIISPHAGYIYSGQIAADAFSQAADHSYDLIILLGVNHTSPGFTDISVYPGGYKTPLGLAETDKDFAKQLVASGKNIVFDESVHAREHSIEVMVPFVQVLFPNVRIVPIIVGTPDLNLCTRFGKTLAHMLKSRKALIVASCDLSHYPNYEDAKKADKKTLEAIMTLEPDTFFSTIREQERSGIKNLATCACGAAPVMTVMAATKRLGANSAKLVSYANSGDVPVGSRDRVVGYGAVSFVKNNK